MWNFHKILDINDTGGLLLTLVLVLTLSTLSASEHPKTDWPASW